MTLPVSIERLTALTLASCMASSCATIDVRRVPRTALVDEEETLVPVGERHPVVDVRMSGAVAFVTGERVLSCERRRVQTFEVRTLEVRQVHGNMILTEALAGATGVVAGGVLLALAPGASDQKRFDAQSGDETFSSQDGMYAVGGLALGLGALFTALAVGNAARARDRELAPVRQKRAQVLGTESCHPQPLASAPLQWLAGSASGDIGTLDAGGEARVDLKAVLPLTLFHGDTPATHARFRVDGADSPPLDLTVLASAHATDAWTTIGPEPDEAALRSFLDHFPWSAEAEPARLRLDGLLAARERKAWASIEQTTAVAELEEYLADFPRGAHAPEARSRVVAILVVGGELEEAAAWSRAQARRSDLSASERARLALLPAQALEAHAEKLWAEASASRDPSQLAAFLERYPTHANAKTACVRLVEALIDKRALAEAATRIESCSSDQRLDPAETERLQTGIAAAQAAIRRQVIAASDDISAIAASCASKPPETRKSLARKAYAKIRRLAGRAPKAELDQLQYKVAARCGYTPQSAGAK